MLALLLDKGRLPGNIQYCSGGRSWNSFWQGTTPGFPGRPCQYIWVFQVGLGSCAPSEPTYHQVYLPECKSVETITIIKQIIKLQPLVSWRQVHTLVFKHHVLYGISMMSTKEPIRTGSDRGWGGVKGFLPIVSLHAWLSFLFAHVSIDSPTGTSGSGCTPCHQSMCAPPHSSCAA